MRLLESDLKEPRASTLSHFAYVQAYGDAELTDRAGSWAFGLTNAKLFLKHHCDFATGKSSNETLMSFAAVTEALVGFVDSAFGMSERLSLAASLRALYFKTMCLEASARHVGIVEPLHTVLGMGAEDTLAALAIEQHRGRGGGPTGGRHLARGVASVSNLHDVAPANARA